MKPWFDKIVGLVVAIAAIVGGMIAYQQIKKRQAKSENYDRQAEWLERNEHVIDRAAERAREARARQLEHAAVAESKRVRAENRLREVAEKRGSNKVQDLADRLNAM